MMNKDDVNLVDEPTSSYSEINKFTEKARFIVALKTTIGREQDVSISIKHRVSGPSMKDAGIFSLLSPDRLRGYILVEFGLNFQQVEDIINDLHYRDAVKEELNDHKLIGHSNSVVGRIIKDKMSNLLKGLKYARGVVTGISSIDEIEHFLSPPPIVLGIDEGDIVEIIKGPFKGEKARVSHKDESNEMVTVELLDAMVTIPLTLKGSHVRVIQKEGE